MRRRQLTPADLEDLENERCRAVPRGRHSLIAYVDGRGADGQVVCENPGCPVDATHPNFRGRQPAASRSPRAPMPAPPAPPQVKLRLWPWVASAGGVAFLAARAKGWSP